MLTQFSAPSHSFGNLDPEAAATLITAATDVALIVDGDGVIRDMAFGSEELSREGHGSWLGKPWAETVTVESRPKVEALLQGAAAKSTPRWRQVNHPSVRGVDVPVMYSAIQLGNDGRVIAVGRDLRVVATLQQRLVDAQQSIERDYARLRHAETRYRLLFQIATEAVFIVDAASLKVLEANPAAGTLLNEKERRVVGRPFIEAYDAPSVQAIHEMLAGVRAVGKAEEARVRLLNSPQEFLLSASMFRQEGVSVFLLRLAPIRNGQEAQVPRSKSRLIEVVEALPDGFVVTDLDGRILVSNRAFLDLAQLATENQANGQPLDRWLGRPGVDLNVLINNLRQHGSVRLFGTVLRDEFGTSLEVEVSAVSVPSGDQPCLGFTIRHVGRRLTTQTRAGRELLRSVEQLTEMVGRVSLKDLVRESTDTIERLCIEAALELTGDNRASAAVMLGLSRQSLYVKLRRYGLGDLDNDGE